MVHPNPARKPRPSARPGPDFVSSALEVSQQLLHLPSCNPAFAKEAVRVYLGLYEAAKLEGNRPFMQLACKGLQLGWSKLEGRAWKPGAHNRRQQARPPVHHRPDPEAARLFYEAYLSIVEDPDYHRRSPQALAN